MKKYILIIMMAGFAFLAQGQQELMVSQYMFNGLLLNPAYAGSHPYFSTSLLHRSQWVKFDNAPVNQVFAIDGPIANNKMGVGLHVTNDSHGIINQLDIGASFSYKLQLGEGDLSFGLRASMASYSAKISEITVWDEDDVYNYTDIDGAFATKFGFGIYYNTDDWYAGLSIPTIYSLDDNILQEGSLADTYFAQHYYLNGGVVFKPSYTLAIKPSILVKYLPAAPIEVDINCNFLINRRLWLGAGYRTNDALIAMIEYNITPQLRAGYAYDYTLTDIGTYSNGSHEIMLGFDFGRDVEIKKRSPRYF